MRSSFDPFGSTSMIVDKLIGNAFGIVEFVAKNMTHVRRVSFYMKNIYDASSRLTKLVTLTGPDTAGTYVEVPLPAVIIEGEDGTTSSRQLLLADVLGLTTAMIDTNGDLQIETSGLWTTKVTAAGNLRVTLPGNAGSTVLERPMSILIDFVIPAQT